MAIILFTIGSYYIYVFDFYLCFNRTIFIYKKGEKSFNKKLVEIFLRIYFFITKSFKVKYYMTVLTNTYKHFSQNITFYNGD